MSHRWDVAHAMDFDTIPPAVIAAKLKRKSVVYELADIYEYIIPLPSFLNKFFIFIDKIFMRLTDGVIAESESEIKGLKGKQQITVHSSL